MIKKIIYCIKCKKHHTHVSKFDKNTYNILFYPVKIEREALICTECGTENFDIDTETRNMSLATDLFREKFSIPSPEEFSLFRKKSGISLIQAANKLKLPQESIREFEEANVVIQQKNVLINLNKINTLTPS
jgi:hypothetical protein